MSLNTLARRARLRARGFTLIELMVVLVIIGVLAALIVLLEAVVAFLAYLGVPVPWARLIVGVVLALVGYGLVRSGMSGLKASNLVPNRTVEQLSRDATVAKEQVQ